MTVRKQRLAGGSGFLSETLRGKLIDLILLLLMCGVVSGMVLAQSTFGTVLGTVRDSSGSSVPNATVKLTNIGENTSRVTTTNKNGDYEFVNSKPGRYRVEISAAGFEPSVANDLVLIARQTLRADCTLLIGKLAQTVDVSARAGVITSETQTISSTFNAQKILNLPANYRASGSTSPYVIISALPGVQGDNQNNFSIQGGIPSQSQFSVDGISTTDVTGNSPLREAFPSAEAIAEIKVQGVGNSAEYGQVGDVTTISKSGTNEYHGALFWDHQNRAFDAKAYGAIDKPQKIGNDYGVSGGGPVRLPWLFNGKDKTFFFADFEGFKFPRGATIQNTVPTQNMRDGNFSLENVVVKDPLTGSPFPNNRIPVSRISPVAQAILKLYPLPNAGATDVLHTANFIANRANDYNSNQYDIRIDHYLNSKQSIYGRWTWKNIDVKEPNILTLPSSSNLNQTRMLVVSHNYTITPSLLNEVRFGFTLNKTGRQFPFDGRAFTNSLGLEGIGPEFPFNGLPDVSFSDLQNLDIDHADGLSQSRTFRSSTRFELFCLAEPRSTKAL